MKGRSSFLILAEEVLKRNPNRPMSASAIWDYAVLHGLAPDVKGATPWQTLKSKITVDIRTKGGNSPFARAGAGRFVLRSELTGKEFATRPWRPPVVTEAVAVVPAELIDKIGRFQGISKTPQRIYERLLCSGVAFTVSRTEAEKSEEFKQILTYVMVVRGDQVLSFTRGTNVSSEKSLRGASCLGFGGHVNSEDLDLWSPDDVGLFASAARELCEEIDMPSADRERLGRGQGLSLVGFLNDDSSPVGRKHFAAVMLYEVTDDPAWDAPQKGEKSITKVGWVDPLDAAFDLTSYEYWSQLLVREFFPGARAAKPSFRLRRPSAFRSIDVLCVVGQIGSGKTEACRVLAEDFGFELVQSGRAVAELIGMPPIPLTDRSEFQRRSMEFIETPEGPDILARRLLELCQDPGRTYLLDGVRQIRTLDALRQHAYPRRISVLYVHAPPDVAFKFYRRREDSGTTDLDFFKLRDAKVESEVPEMLDVADAALYNWFGSARYRAAIHDLFRTARWPRSQP